jgi:hypothetical protein
VYVCALDLVCVADCVCSTGRVRLIAALKGAAGILDCIGVIAWGQILVLGCCSMDRIAHSRVLMYAALSAALLLLQMSAGQLGGSAMHQRKCALQQSHTTCSIALPMLHTMQGIAGVYAFACVCRQTLLRQQSRRLAALMTVRSCSK